MLKQLKSVIVLSVICLILAAALGAVNYITAPIIKDADALATQNSLKEVYPMGDGFEAVDLSAYDNIPKGVVEAYASTDGGYVIKVTATGYKSGLVILCGISPEGDVVGAKYLSSQETLEAEKTYGANLIGANLDSIDSVDTVAGVTKTTSAYKNAVKDALGTVVIIGGGDFDNRTEEEIALDEALPSAEGDFEAFFYAEKIEGLTAIFKAFNGTGYVFRFGELYIGVDIDGTVLNHTDSEYAANIDSYLSAILYTETESFMVLEPLPDSIKHVEKTISGNYIFHVEAIGFDAQSKHSSTKAPIKIKVSVSADGEIICCMTVLQNETEGYGAACEEYTYYNQYNGKNENNYKDVDAIAGATVTSVGYNAAIGTVFEAMKIIIKEAP